jgi:hypothetical protein
MVGGGFRLQRVGVSRGVAEVSQRCRKGGRKWRNFGCAGLESRTIGAIRIKKSFTLTRTGIERTMAAVFGVKKEIPVYAVRDRERKELKKRWCPNF